MRDEMVVFIHERLPRYTIAFVTDTNRFVEVDMIKNYIKINKQYFDYIEEDTAKNLIEHELIHAEHVEHGKQFDDMAYLRKIPKKYWGFHIGVYYNNIKNETYVYVITKDEIEYVFSSYQQYGDFILPLDDVYQLFNINQKPDIDTFVHYAKLFINENDLPIKVRVKDGIIVLGVRYANA